MVFAEHLLKTLLEAQLPCCLVLGVFIKELKIKCPFEEALSNCLDGLHVYLGAAEIKVRDPFHLGIIPFPNPVGCGYGSR